MNTGSLTMKMSSGKRINLIPIGFGFSIIYWILESVRDVITFERGTIAERIFFPDAISFWMRVLVICVLVLLSVYAQSLQDKIEAKKKDQPHSFNMINMLKAGAIFGGIYWILESVRDVVSFGKGDLIRQILAPDPVGFWMRMLAIFIIVLFSLYAQSLIEERKQAEAALKKAHDELEQMVKERTRELRKVNRELQAITECNQAIVRAADEKSLFRDIYEIMKNVGGYKLAWVVLGDGDSTDTLHIAYPDTFDEDTRRIIDSACIRMNLKTHPIGCAAVTGHPSISRRLSDQEDDMAWDAELIAKGYTALISLPLIHDGHLQGLLNLCSSEEEAFNKEEVQLLMELAGDLSFGILALRTRMERQKAEEEKIQIQGQLLQAQKMEAIGILAGGVAHDFNNLLTAIQVSADLAMMQIEPADPLYKDLQEINNVSSRAADLARQLLLFSRKHPMEPSILSLNNVINNLLKMLHRLIGEEVKIVTVLENDLWNLKADRCTLEQVVMNLTVNARDAMDGSGLITIKTENVELDHGSSQAVTESRPGQFVRLSVIDNGLGMARETLEHIFEPFFSTKGQGKGTGLGLSVVYGIVKQHDGWITVRSEKGKGTTFEVYLPANHKDDASEDIFQSPWQAMKGTGKRILFVEDERSVREFVVRGLDKIGYKVFPAATGKEALEIFQNEKADFHLVVSDVVLPDLTGVELAEKIKTANPGLPVLLSSGYTDHKSQWDDIQQKGYRFLQKPYDLTDLLRIIQDMDQ